MKIVKLMTSLVVFAGISWTLSRTPDLLFTKRMLDVGAAETCAFADMNGDGKMDIVSGENWFESPAWNKHPFRKLPYSNFYVDDFSTLPIDINQDGKIDLVDCAWFSKRLWWSENPGPKGGTWKEHTIDEGHNVEFAFLVDLQNSGTPRDVLPEFGGKDDPLTWYAYRKGGFVPHAISPHSFGHGIGAGDVNRDGRTDIVTPQGWFEAPADPQSNDWKFHADFNLGVTGFIYVLDINGDGRNDLITTMAHDSGFFWMENRADGTWEKHMIDDGWAGGHAMTMTDINGDGKVDFVTGKRFMAHNGHDNGEREPLGVYWYEFLKAEDGHIEWVKHILDYGGRTGGGMQIPVMDIDGDGKADVAVGGKSGLFLFQSGQPATR